MLADVVDAYAAKYDLNEEAQFTIFVGALKGCAGKKAAELLVFSHYGTVREEVCQAS